MGLSQQAKCGAFFRKGDLNTPSTFCVMGNVTQLKIDFVGKGINLSHMKIQSVKPLFLMLILPLLRNTMKVSIKISSPRRTVVWGYRDNFCGAKPCKIPLYEDTKRDMTHTKSFYFKPFLRMFTNTCGKL